MAMRKLYGRVDSLDTMRALASLFEHRLEFEFIQVTLHELNTQPFLSLSPFGEVPVLQDGDLVLFESRTIMRFISHAYLVEDINEHTIYMAPKLQGIVAAWIDVEDHHFHPSASKLISELIDKPGNGLHADEAVVATEEAKLGKVLDVYEEKLGNSKFLGGDKYTSADLTHLPYLHHLVKTPITKRLFESRPRVNAWSIDILARPAWAKVVELVENRSSS